MRTLIAGLGAWFVLAPASLGQPGVTHIDPPTGWRALDATEISGDGSTIVGTGRQFRDGAFGVTEYNDSWRWSRNSGFEWLGLSHAYVWSSSPAGLSRDGSTVMGVACTGIVFTHSYAWRLGDGIVNIGSLVSEPELDVTVYAVDGTGRGYGTCGFTPFTVAWGEPLQARPSPGEVVIWAAAEGVVGGYCNSLPFRWRLTDGLPGVTLLPLLGGTNFGAVDALSTDGTIGVGHCRTSSYFYRGCRWNAGGGIDLIQSPDGRPTYPTGCNSDATLVVGSIFEGYQTIVDAFVWREGAGFDLLRVFLAHRGRPLPADLVPQRIKVSEDGLTLAVVGFLNNEYHTYVVRLPVCGGPDFNGDGNDGTDADVEAFFRCLGGSCCPGCFSGGSDFNGDGDVGTDHDIEAFFRVLALRLLLSTNDRLSAGSRKKGS